MGRTYAGILGPISFGTVIASNLIDGGSIESAMIFGSLALFAFAAIGYVVGVVAERIVVEAITLRFRSGYQGAGRRPYRRRLDRPLIRATRRRLTGSAIPGRSAAAGRRIQLDSPWDLWTDEDPTARVAKDGWV